MNVASRELCEELYEVSGWGADPLDKDDDIRDWYGHPTDLKGWVCPKYDLGYLLRKLPEYIKDSGGYRYFILTPVSGYWCAQYGRSSVSVTVLTKKSASPEDALCKLAIELVKQGILK